MRAMDGEQLGANRIKLGFGKCMPSRCVWLDGVAETVSEAFVYEQFSLYGSVFCFIIDRKRGQALVFYDQVSLFFHNCHGMAGVLNIYLCCQFD